MADIMGLGSFLSGAAGGILGADMGRQASSDAGDAQKAAIAQYIAKLDAVGMPPDQSAKLILDQYKQAGILTPELEQQINAQVSQFAQVKSDPAAMDMQRQALSRMSALGQAGLTPDERAQQRILQQQNQQANNGNQQAIIQNMQARGQQGSGAEIAARLGSAQGAANNASSSADQISSMAAQRALQAIGQSGSMAGNLENQVFGEEATKANAGDQMNRFNIQNQMAINQRNVAQQNQAQAANLANLQQLNNANVGQTNQEQYNALQRQRQNWQDKLAYAGAYSQPLQAYGNAAANQAYGEDKARQQGIASGFGGLSSYLSANPFGGASGQQSPNVDYSNPEYKQKQTGPDLASGSGMIS